MRILRARAHTHTLYAGILTQLENKETNGFHINGTAESVSDTQGGLLQTAFIVSYMLLSPLFGYLGDRYTRKYIITFGVLFWAGFTLAGSFSVVSRGRGISGGGEGVTLRNFIHSVVACDL